LSSEQIIEINNKSGIDRESHERIYQYVLENKKMLSICIFVEKDNVYRKHGASKNSRGIIKNRINIDQRTQIVENKKYLEI
jgi:IS30 family transposase